MKSEYRISVVTVCFNDLEGLKKTIDSVSKQSYSDIEFIIVDGGSIDGTLDFITENRDKISKYVSEKDDGIYDAMNKGIQMCSGDWVVFLNSGDGFAQIDTVRDAVDQFCDPSCMYFGRALIILNEDTSWVYPGKRYNTHSIRRWLRRRLPNHQAMFFPKCFYSNNRYNLQFKISADSDYKLRAFRSVNSVFIDDIICEFGLGGISSTWTWNHLYQQCVDRRDRLYGQCGFFSYMICLFKSILKLCLVFLFGSKVQYLLSFKD